MRPWASVSVNRLMSSYGIGLDQERMDSFPKEDVITKRVAPLLVIFLPFYYMASLSYTHIYHDTIF